MSDENYLTKDILNSISEGVFTVDKTFRITFFNRAAEEITGFKSEQIIGKLCKSICNSNLCMECCPIAYVLQTNEPAHDVDGAIQHQSGSSIPVKLNSSILYNSDGEPNGGVISFRDLSEYEAIKSHLKKSTSFFGVVAHNNKMLDIFELIREIKDSDASVLIQGESGTGKEMIANAVQKTSRRSAEPFVKVNCSIFSPQLLTSELFGHVKGAFTGAIKNRQGRFEIADKGTLFLDEIAETSPEVQLQLLRVLQEGTFERVGESVTKHADVRIIAATNKNLEAALQAGEFRKDLYYRLNVIPIKIPPLRERRDDIPDLVHHFLEKFSLVYRKKVNSIEDDAFDLLMQYDWPGNVRELENVIEFAFARTTESEKIKAQKFANRLEMPAKKIVLVEEHPIEGEIQLLNLLKQHQWNKSKVAKELGIGRTTLWRRMRAMGLVASSESD